MKILKKVFTWSEDRRKILKSETKLELELEPGSADQEIQELKHKGFNKLHGNYKSAIWSKYINNIEYLVYMGE